METIFKRWWLLLLNGILFLILGVISLAYPVTALFSVAVYIGVVALVAGRSWSRFPICAFAAGAGGCSRASST